MIAGTAVTSVLSASYAYSAYRPSLESIWNSSFLASLPFSVFIVVFAFSSIIGGRFYAMKGIKSSVALSILLVSSGLLLSSLIEYIPNPLYLIATYGVITGFRNGFGYIPVVTLARKWFPDKAGLATGIVIFGYGGSALVFAPLKTILLDLHDISTTFLAVGVISAILGSIAYYLIRDPPVEVANYFSSRRGIKATVPKREMGPSEILKTKEFWALWLSFILVSTPGIMLIGHLKSFALSKGLNPIQATLAISVFSVLNAVGRPPAGWISDKMGKYGRPLTMTLFFSLQTILFTTLAMFDLEAIALILIIALAGFFYGSALALYPALTGDFFGIKHLSTNYSLVFTGWGIAGLIAPSPGGYLVEITGGYKVPLLVFSIFSLTGSIICLYLKKQLGNYLG
ncbi:MAG: OFA family MFS transporter [Sulfolobales archaeon]